MHETAKENFDRWFGQSKVCDKDGLPLVLYHGTADDFSRFSLEHSFDGGFHFGTTGAANLRLKYLGGKNLDEFEPDFPPRILPVYLSIQNPKRLDEDPYSEDRWAEQIYAAQQEGHDGIVYKNEYEGGESWVAFRPEQIKSAVGNNGLFSSTNPDITDRAVVAAQQAHSYLDSIETRKAVPHA